MVLGSGSDSATVSGWPMVLGSGGTMGWATAWGSATGWGLATVSG